MQSILTDVRSIYLSVCLSRGSSRLHFAKMAEQIKMVFRVNAPGGPWNTALDVGPDPLTEELETGISYYAYICRATNVSLCI